MIGRNTKSAERRVEERADQEKEGHEQQHDRDRVAGKVEHKGDDEIGRAEKRDEPAEKARGRDREQRHGEVDHGRPQHTRQFPQAGDAVQDEGQEKRPNDGDDRGFGGCEETARHPAQDEHRYGERRGTAPECPAEAAP